MRTETRWSQGVTYIFDDNFLTWMRPARVHAIDKGRISLRYRSTRVHFGMVESPPIFDRTVFRRSPSLCHVSV